MSKTEGGHRLPELLVLASTYPRWLGDHEPGFVHELAKRLTQDFVVTVLCPHSASSKAEEWIEGVKVIRYRYAPARWETLVNDGGIVTNLRRSRWKLVLVPGFVLAQVWAALRLVRRQHFDLLHAHWLIPQGLIAVLLRCLPGRPIPFVVTSHGADLFALKGIVLRLAKRLVVHQAAAVTAVSSAMVGPLKAIGADVQKVQVEPMGVDLSELFTPDERVERSKNEILFVGRLVEKKGLRHLIDAMPAIIDGHPSAFLTIAGFGPEESERRAQVQALGLEKKVFFLGPVAQRDLPSLYRRAGIFVAPFVVAGSGDMEGLGLVSIEAAGCGCPVVCSDLPQVRDAFPPGGGVHFTEPGSSASLAAACLEIFRAPALSFETAAQMRKELMRTFDWRARADAYAALLRRLVP